MEFLLTSGLCHVSSSFRRRMTCTTQFHTYIHIYVRTYVTVYVCMSSKFVVKSHEFGVLKNFTIYIFFFKQLLNTHLYIHLYVCLCMWITYDQREVEFYCSFIPSNNYLLMFFMVYHCCQPIVLVLFIS